jgi:hypothetical protein
MDFKNTIYNIQEYNVWSDAALITFALRAMNSGIIEFWRRTIFRRNLNEESLNEAVELDRKKDIAFERTFSILLAINSFY